MKKDGLGRNWYGGNSGYIGYSKSKRAVEAERRGLRNKSQMNREFLEEVNELLPPERRVTLKKIKENLDNMRYDEWHHTSKYGNKTYYYSAETVAKYFEENSDERKEEKRNKEKHKEWLLQCLSVANERLVIHAKSYADMLGYVSLEKDKNGNKYAYFRASNGLVVVSLNLNEHYGFVYEGVLQENNVCDEYVNYYSNPKGFISRRDIFVSGDEAKTEEMRNLANEAEKEYFKMLDKLYNDVRVMPYKKEYEEAEKMYNEFRFQNLKGTGMGKITKENMSEYLDEVAKASAEFLPLYKDAIDMLEFYDEDADIKENVDMTIEYANELLEKNAPKKEEKGGKTEDSKKEAEELEEWKKYIADLFKEKKKSLNTAGNFDVEAKINDESIDVKVSVKDKKRFKLNFKKWVQNEHPRGYAITYDGDDVIWNCEKDKTEFKEACETFFWDIQYFLDAENYISMSDKEFQQKFEKLSKIQSETLWGDLKRMRNCSDSFIKECKNSISLYVERFIDGDTPNSVSTVITIKSVNANLDVSKITGRDVLFESPFFKNGKSLILISMTGCEWNDFDNLVTNAFKYLGEYLRDICDEADEKSEDEDKTSKPKPEKKPKKASKPKAEKKPKAKKEDNAERVAAITPEKKIIGDFCKLASFSGTASALKDKVRLLLNRLQNAIVQKQIRKTSKYANEIMSIQTKLVSFLNSGATGKVKVEIDNLDELMKIAKSEKVSENVMIARAFIRLNNKSDKMKEATALLKRINKAIEADIANEEVKMLKPSLESFISKKTKAVEPSERALRGLYGLAGVEDGAAANSMQLINQHYDVMTLSGRWKDFIGRPSKNFKMMVYGKPGQGKSTFSILLARYLAKEKGLRVLYVAAEEKFGYTLQEKIKRLEALTPNLDFAEDLTISDLPNYDVVLLDSVNHLQMDADELATLPQNCAYVWIFQATKEGNYKGGQQYAHDSDIVIKVDSMKARTEKNRFGATNVEFDIEDYEN